MFHRLHSSITLEIWKLSARQIRSCWPVAGFLAPLDPDLQPAAGSLCSPRLLSLRERAAVWNHIRASLWVGRLSCPRPLSESGHGQNDHVTRVSTRLHRVCAEESVGILDVTAFSATTHVLMCRVFRNGAVWLLTMRWLLDGASCTTFDGYVTCAHDRRERSRTWSR